jgi:hypothetical protein
MNTNPFPEHQPGDTDLVAEVSKLLKEAGHSNPFSWEQQLGVVDSHRIGPKLQRFLINRYWRLKMGLCRADSTMERYCLIESGEDKDYLEIFKVNILPFIIKNNVG